MSLYPQTTGTLEEFQSGNQNPGALSASQFTVREEQPENTESPMLVTLLDDPVVSLTLPGKVQTYMAAGKPIIGAIGGEAAEVVARAECGYCGGAEDSEALASNARLFCEAVLNGEAVKMGKNAEAFYREHFTKEKFFEVLHANFKG